MPIQRHRTTWTGFVGAPGVTTLFWDIAATPNLTAWNTFLAAIASRVPNVVTWTSQGQGDVLSEVTGILSGSWSATPPAPVAATATGNYASVAGAVINWRTNGLANGHRVRGRTFLVPLVGSSFDTDGSISGTVLTSMRAALATFVSAVGTGLVVWHRPVGGGGGSQHAIVNADIPDKAVVLRSRRD